MESPATASGLRAAEQPTPAVDFAELVGQGPPLLEVLRQIELVARTGSAVLIHGETGTGKELVARAIHRVSGRKGPFVPVNVAAAPAGVWESEMFGHERGAFTGAISRRVGRFEQAHDGTLFLDEIGELDASLQPKLLRLLQEREFERVGGTQTLRWNGRLVVATNRDLRDLVDASSFRADLYYRLNVYPIVVPPLRARRDDISRLAVHFVRTFAQRMGRAMPLLTPATIAQLEQHDWPGNVRELQNVIERALVHCRDTELRVELEQPRPAETLSHATSDALDHVHRVHILRVLQKSNWVIAGPNGAAARLGIKRTTLNHRLKKLGIQRTATESSSGTR